MVTEPVEDPALVALELEMLDMEDHALKWTVLLAGRELERRGLARVIDHSEED